MLVVLRSFCIISLSIFPYFTPW